VGSAPPGDLAMSTQAELLQAHHIALTDLSPGRHYTTCPECSATRTNSHRTLKCLGVTIGPDDKVFWGCNHCGWQGPEKGARAKANGADKPELTTYVYRDASGTPLFRKVRNLPGREPRFWLKQRDVSGWRKGTAGVDTTVLYRIDEVAQAIGAGRVICLVEGEKDADSLWRLGFAGTCNAHGAHDPTKRQKPKWYVSHSAQLKGADVVVLNDNDPPGYEHADTTCKLSLGVAKRVRRLDLALHWPGIPKCGDVSDWIAAGHGREELAALIDGAPDYERGDAKAPREPNPPKPEPTPEPEKHGLPNYSDEALALTFADRHHADLRFVPLWSKWLLWDGARWKLDDRTVAFTRARIICREVAATYKGKRACDIASSKKVAAIGTLARGDSRHVATADQWDARLTRLSMPTRTMDLETGRSHPPDPLDYSTKVTAATAAPEGTDCPLWLAFLRNVTGEDEDVIGFLRRFLGYCLTGLTIEHSLLFLFGTGSNGKSVFTSVLTAIFGDYAINAPMEMFIATHVERHPTEIARLRGARLVVAHETQKGRRWDESKLKTLTGGDPVSGRFMRGDFFDFNPTHKFIIAGNHKPGFRSVDEAIRRRFLLVPFTITIPKEERDRDLTEKLKAEGPAILRWMVDGALEWQCDGLMVPDKVRAATDEYLADQDSLSQWAEECTEADESPFAFETTRALFKSWRGWAEDRNLAVGTETVFADSLKDRGFEHKRTEKARGFKGIRLKFDAEAKAESEPWEMRQ
jgi:putative DNA primase/helicase